MSSTKLIMENWRRFIKEEEGEFSDIFDQEEAERLATYSEPEGASGSWPSKPPKDVKITARSGLSPETILETWNSLAALNPPKDPVKVLASIGGEQQLIKNVQLLEKQFAAAASNPPRIKMPHVDPGKDMDHLKGSLGAGGLDVKSPFAGASADDPPHTVATPEDFPEDLLGKSPEDREAWLSKGKRDGELGDDSAVTMGEVTIPVSATLPSQSEVYLDKSMYNILKFGPLAIGGTQAYNGIAIKTKDGGIILDGHHRWSSAFISGGESANIKVQGIMGLDLDSAIAALRSYGNARGNPQKP